MSGSLPPTPGPGEHWVNCLPLHLWPAPDRAAWEKALRTDDIFESGGTAAAWPEASRRKRISGYGRWLFFLSTSGELDPDQGPADRVTRERVSDYLAELEQTTRGHSIQNRIQELGDIMRVLAPEGDWGWILRGASRKRADTIPAIDKRTRLRPIQELLSLGIKLMDEAESDHRSNFLRALQYRDGLVIAILSLHPIRLRNLVELALGRSIVEAGDDVLIQIPETKTGSAYHTVLSAPLVERFRCYLKQHRPVLLAVRGRRWLDPGNAVWISRRGVRCGEDALWGIVRKHTGKDGRPPLSVHLFRTCAPTSIAIHAAESVHIIPPVLGHSSPLTYQRYYNLANGLEASRAHAAVIEQLATKLYQPPSRRRQRAPSSRSRKIKDRGS